MQHPEKPGTALEVAKWFAGSTAPRASAHKMIDPDQCVRSVPDIAVAWAAPGANNQGLHYEHPGYSEQSAAEWADPYSERTLRFSAHHAAHDCATYRIPIEYVDRNGLRAGRRGITTHNEVSQAFKKSDHWDPGPGFPIGHYIDLVRAHGAPGGPATIPEHRAEETNEMAEPVGAICINGTPVVVTRDGGVRIYGLGAPFFGSVPALKPENRRTFGFARGIEEIPGGYRITGDQSNYDFTQATKDAIDRGEL
jgi:hypothetical protein